MSETALTVLQPNQALVQQGGVGLDFASNLFRLKPATININQPNTQAEGAKPGLLRISETGDQFEEMFVTLLTMPTERRDFYEGEPGQLNRSADNLMCFSRNVVRGAGNRELQGPDERAKVPQALKCANCPKASWDKYRQTKLKKDIPPCDAYYYAVFIDTVYKMPMQMYIRSKSKKPFEAGMQNLARTFAKMKSQGLNPNIFDIRFRLSTEKIANDGKLASYVIRLSDFQAINKEARAEFGEIYLNYVNRGHNPNEEPDTKDAVSDAQQTIESQAVEPGAESDNVIEGEIQI